jgi:hypothetical protein
MGNKMPGQVANYAQADFTIGDLKGDILEKLNDNKQLGLRTDYTVEEIQQKRNVEKELDKAHGDAECALYPFGKYDN